MVGAVVGTVVGAVAGARGSGEQVCRPLQVLVRGPFFESALAVQIQQ